MDNAKQAKRFRVSGSVQGVGFRYFTQKLAVKLGLTGYAKNLPDGTVEILAIGSPEALGQLRKALHRGPRLANVAAVSEESSDLHAHNFDGFHTE